MGLVDESGLSGSLARAAVPRGYQKSYRTRALCISPFQALG
jgi:hypothetical protein